MGYYASELHCLALEARQIQRLVQPVAATGECRQEREALVPEPGTQAVPVM